MWKCSRMIVRAREMVFAMSHEGARFTRLHVTAAGNASVCILARDGCSELARIVSEV
jgi:hypothetical protein